MKTRHTVILAALAACSAPDTPHADAPTDQAPGASVLLHARTEASMVAADPEGTLALDPDRGSLLVHREGVELVEVTLGEEPVRMVAAGDHLFVTLAGAQQVVRLDRTALGASPWAVGARVDLPGEPYGLALTHGSDHLWVALPLEDQVVRLDPTTLAVIETRAVLGQPTWLAAPPMFWPDDVALDDVFVGLAREPGVAVIRRDRVDRLALPNIRRFEHMACPKWTLDRRITGDVRLTAAGEILVPALYADTYLHDAGDLLDTQALDTGFFHTGFFGIFVPNRPDCIDPGPNGSGGGGMYGEPRSVEPFVPEVARLNPALVVLHDEPGATAEAIHLTARTTASDCAGVVGSYPTDVQVQLDRDGARTAMVAMESSQAIVRFDLDAPRHATGRFDGAGLEVTCVPKGIRSMGYDPEHGEVLALSTVEREVHRWRGLANGDEVDHVDFALPASPLSEVLLGGRALFFDSTHPAMAAAGSGVSCSTCHPDGRNDGFTWKFSPTDHRNTPSLAGRVSDTLPITWRGSVATVVDEVMETSSERMGGGPLHPDAAQAVARFVDHTRAVRKPRHLDADQVARGRALFERADVGCAACHSGEQGTDNTNHQVFGFAEATNTPKLAGVRATGPYLHDGSAPTLRDVLVRARRGEMGNTGMLSEPELDDLEAYLRSW